MKMVRWSLIAAFLCGLGLLLLFSGYGLSQGYDVAAGLRHIFASAPEPVASNPQLSDVDWQEVAWLADIENRSLNESSGLAASHLFDDVLYSINDSGSEPLLYAMDLSGRHRGTWRVAVDKAVDWEAMDAFTLNGQRYVLIADTGDNLRWRNEVSLLVVPEPEILDRDNATLPVEWIVNLTYPDAAYDVEAVAVDAAAEWVYLLTKRQFPHRLYRVPLQSEGAATAELVTTIATLPQPDELDFATLEKEARFRHMPTGMDIAGDGKTLAVTTLKHAYLFDLEHLENPPRRVRLPTSGQREGITFAARSSTTLYFSKERFEGIGDADLYELTLSPPLAELP